MIIQPDSLLFLCGKTCYKKDNRDEKESHLSLFFCPILLNCFRNFTFLFEFINSIATLKNFMTWHGKAPAVSTPTEGSSSWIPDENSASRNSDSLTAGSTQDSGEDKPFIEVNFAGDKLNPWLSHSGQEKSRNCKLSLKSVRSLPQMKEEMNNSNRTHLIDMHLPSTVLKPSLISRINMEISSPTPYSEKEKTMLAEEVSNMKNLIQCHQPHWCWWVHWRNIQGEWTWLGRKHWSPRWRIRKWKQRWIRKQIEKPRTIK